MRKEKQIESVEKGLGSRRNRLPRVQNGHSSKVCLPVVTLKWLIRCPADRALLIMAKQQTSYGAMRDHSNIAISVRANDALNRQDDSPLCVDCPLPSLYTAFWFREEGICQSLEVVTRQISRGASVILTKFFINLNPYQVTLCQNVRGFDRLGFGA